MFNGSLKSPDMLCRQTVQNEGDGCPKCFRCSAVRAGRSWSDVQDVV